MTSTKTMCSQKFNLFPRPLALFGHITVARVCTRFGIRETTLNIRTDRCAMNERIFEPNSVLKQCSLEVSGCLAQTLR